MATKYFALKPFKHGKTHYRPGDEITGFTGWWRYWRMLRWQYVDQIDTVAAPTIDSITPGNEELLVAFTAVEIGGDPFTDVEYNLDGGTWNSSGGTTSPFTIGELTNGTTYAVRVRANTEAGAGAASNPVNGIPATKADIPTELVATPSDTDVSIAFVIASDGGNTVTDVQYKFGTGEWLSTDPETTASPIVIPDLEAGTEYSVRLRSVNDYGSSNQSEAVVFTTDSVPDAPTALVATVGNETVSIAFTPGADNGSAITNYKYTMNDGVLWTAFDPADATSPVVIAPLPNDVEYTVKLRAVNAVGDGAASEAVVFTPVDQVPAAPTNLVATPAALAVSLAFTAPDNGGSAILEYEYTFNDGADWYGTTPDTTASPMELSVPADDYTMKIRAVNAVGAGPASAAVTFTVPGA